MKFAERLAEDRRLVILRLLSEAPDYRANEALIRDALEDWGHSVTRDQVRTDLAWLAEQALLRTEEIAGVVIATSTKRGADVAKGYAIVPGVKRPSPGD